MLVSPTLTWLSATTANSDWLDLVLGPLGLLVFLLTVVVMGGIKKWWVFGWIFNDVIKERDMYRERAFKSQSLAEQSTDIARNLTTSLSQVSDEDLWQELLKRRRGIANDKKDE